MNNSGVTPIKERAKRIPKPPWLRVKAPNSGAYNATRKLMRTHKLNTVCEEVDRYV